MPDQPTQNQTPPAVPLVPQDKPELKTQKIETPKIQEIKKPIESEQKPVQTPIPISPDVKPLIQNQSEIKTPEQNSLASENPIPAPPIIKAPTPATTPTRPKQPAKQQTPVLNQQNSNIIKSLLKKAREHIQKRRQKRLDKILIALKEKNKLSNREIKKIVRISEATITRYMDILEKQNKVKQIGKEGRSVYYELK
ncbi:MAG: winged helix-turn-helix transcriptional regulator [Patescibacteria group bacterium]|nr:winged helix-turn-helix transcriptional regulator [Patescibacteria group bacterium]